MTEDVAAAAAAMDGTSPPQPPQQSAAAAAAPPPPGSPLRLYAAHLLIFDQGPPGQGGGDQGQEATAPPPAAAAAQRLHQYLYEHPNGLFIVGLAKGHAAVEACRADGSVVVQRIDFLPTMTSSSSPPAESQPPPPATGHDEPEAEEQEDEEEGQEADGGKGSSHSNSGGGGGGGLAALLEGNRVSTRRGKKTKGAIQLKADTVLAHVVLSDGRALPVYCGVEGQLLELNDRLAQDPSLLARKPTTEGFLAIVQPPRFSAHKVDRSRFLTLPAYRERAGPGVSEPV